MKLWHCKQARSLRAVWALEEMAIEYELEILPFPPRFMQPEYLEVNPLGTVPFLVDGDTTMTESIAICHYLAEKYHKDDFTLKPDHPEYGDYLNWLYHGDATLTFPQTIFLRYAMLETKENRQPKVADDYRKWYLKRLVRLNKHIVDREFLCGQHFTIADIAITYALFLGKLIGIDVDYEPQVKDYLDRMTSRPGFIQANGK